ncbi:MAG: DUF1566 domain-containing protein [Flavobacteriales bacterium]|nr:DUF1566 domain-containing protein [Flavobacteriales bacterium]
MKKILTIILSLLISVSVWAQSPESMSYQAVIRDAGNAVVASQSVGMQISILQGSASGSSVYTETQNPSTNINGLVSIEIGTGNVESGDFTTIDWANDVFYIMTETDPTGGTDYTITGTSQLMSVPYALHAKTAGSVTGTNALPTTSNAGDMNYWNGSNWVVVTGGTEGATLQFVSGVPTWVTPSPIAVQSRLDDGETPEDIYTSDNTFLDSLYGKTYEGGLIAYYDIANGTGLIAAESDQSTGAPWGCTGTLIGADGSAIGTGNQNTIDIESGCATPGTAADICANLEIGIYIDWYLPSKDELNQLYLNIGQGSSLPAGNIGGFAINGYWSSTEIDNLNAWKQLFNNGVQYSNYKSASNYVRAVRAF